jgi:hypothetical protein
LLAACATDAPVKQFSAGDEIAFYDFTSPASFEEGTYGEGVARLQISQGEYTIVLSEGDNTIYFGQWGDTLNDVIIDVDARQTTEDQNTAYGVMCRTRGRVGQTVNPDEEPASPSAEAATSETTAEATGEATLVEGAATVLNNNNGDGYLFLIQGTGRFAIMQARGRTITPLVDWTSNGAINTGAAQNRIRAICAGTYLAMYVNGQFMADTSDDIYKEGQVALAAAAATRTGVNVSFDNLAVVKPEAASSS